MKNVKLLLCLMSGALLFGCNGSGTNDPHQVTPEEIADALILKDIEYLQCTERSGGGESAYYYEYAPNICQSTDPDLERTIRKFENGITYEMEYDGTGWQSEPSPVQWSQDDTPYCRSIKYCLSDSGFDVDSLNLVYDKTIFSYCSEVQLANEVNDELKYWVELCFDNHKLINFRIYSIMDGEKELGNDTTYEYKQTTPEWPQI